MGGNRRGVLGLDVHFFALRLENFASVFLRFLRSIRIWKRVIDLETTGQRDLERIPRTGDGRFVTSDLVSPQLVVNGLVGGRGERRIAKLMETFRRVLFSFGGRVGVGYGGFQPANHMTLIFICGTQS